MPLPREVEVVEPITGPGAKDGYRFPFSEAGACLTPDRAEPSSSLNDRAPIQ
jgi:hypothetical protein